MYDTGEPLRLGYCIVFVKELFHSFVASDEIEVDDERELLQVNGTQEHGLLEVLFEMTGAVHATVEIDAVLHAQQVTRLVDEQFTRAHEQYRR